MIDQDKTNEMKESEQVWVSQSSSGLDKRQATLQLCIRAEGLQNVEPGIVFQEKEMLLQKRKLNMMRGLTFPVKAVPGWTVIFISNG